MTQVFQIGKTNNHNPNEKITMKKILTITLVLSLAVPAYAYDGSATNTTKSWTSWWDWWSGFTPADPTEPSDPTVPEVEVGIPTITESRFYHSASVASLRNRLQIQWDTVEGAESYEIEVFKADGTILTYSASTNSLMVKNMACAAFSTTLLKVDCGTGNFSTAIFSFSSIISHISLPHPANSKIGGSVLLIGPW